MDLLWENASPTSTFLAQTISIEKMNNYKEIDILFETGQNPETLDGYIRTRILTNDINKKYISFCIIREGGISLGSFYSRSFTILEDGLQFNNATNNGMMIHYRIYGIK